MVQETNGSGDEGSESGQRTRHLAAPIKPIKRVPIRTIKDAGETVLVEWAVGDDFQRAYVPTAEVVEGSCAADVLEIGVPYGEPWETFIKVKVTPAMVARELRRAGIWTLDDLQRNVAKAKMTVWEAAQFDLGALIRAVEEARK
jgi:hypothetical protein